MKKNLLFILIPLFVLVVLFWTGAFYSLIPQAHSEKQPHVTDITAAEDVKPENEKITNGKIAFTGYKTDENPENITSYALSLLGTPYVYAGISPSGFDCSGFVTHVFDNFGIDLPHSSAMQAMEGANVNKSEARTGDLVIFTGTDPSKREPGHVGIVISEPGDTIEFVHSSSNGGVKISKVQGTRYDIRFLEIRRVL